MSEGTAPAALTPAQRKFLKRAAQPGGARAVATHLPVVRLQEMGLIKSTGPMVNWVRTWVVTELGQERVQKLRKSRRKTCLMKTGAPT